MRKIKFGENMDLDKLAYPEAITIDGLVYKGKRNMSKGELLIPYSDEPDVGIGDVIVQKSGKREIHLKILDASFLDGGTNNLGTKHPHMLRLHVENTTAAEHMTKANSSTFNIGSITGDQVQVGNENSQVTNINIQQLVEHVAKSNDEEAKSTLKKLLQNSTVGSLIGAGAGALLGLL